VKWLAPLAALYGGAAALRASLYDRGLLRRARLAGPVISVGNLSVGGSGKTPVVIRMAEILMEEGLPVSILSRGYGGAFAGDALVVGDGSRVLADARQAGDEPALMARRLPGAVVAVGRRRDVVGRVVEARFGPRIHLLDDGFQHLRLARDLDVVCVRPSDLVDRPLPAGRLRERPSALARANLVLVVDDPGRLVGDLPGSVVVFRLSHRVEGFVDPGGRPAAIPGRPFLVSGIARPERFEADVRGLAAGVVGTARFRDHHRFTRAEAAAIFERAKAAGADSVVTTAKDEVRFPPVDVDLPLLVLRISARIDDEAGFRDRLLRVARRAA
jgi:tetraacyldisaccharide 4'-kinase